MTKRKGGQQVADGDLVMQRDLTSQLSDGTVLFADVLRPASAGKYPVIIVRTPYDKDTVPSLLAQLGLDPLTLVRHGYSVVAQDVRGTGKSGGEFQRWRFEQQDGVETVAWAESQPWSNGNVGIIGLSYLGAAALYAAIGGPPGLKAIIPAIAPAAHYDGGEYEGGAFQLGRVLTGVSGMASASLRRAATLGEDVSAEQKAISSILRDPMAALSRLPLAALPRENSCLRPDWGEWLANPDPYSHGQDTAINRNYASMRVPALHIGGWYDMHLKGTLENFVGLKEQAATGHARSNQQLIITPWTHYPPWGGDVGELWLGAETMNAEFVQMQLDFLDAFLKGGRPRPEPPVRIFVMGINSWRDEDDWPLTRARPTRFFLRAEGSLTLEPPASTEIADEFVYDPRRPVPTIGGNTLFHTSQLMGPRDRAAVERREDVLIYTSDVLTQALEVTGPLRAHLFVATSAPDTDFTVALVDVHPDGRAIGLADGIRRLRYRYGAASTLVKQGEVCEIEVDLVATSNVFLRGHQIRIEISSSNFPRFDRNPNHGGVISEATEHDLAKARQVVFHDDRRPSHITLPVVPGG